MPAGGARPGAGRPKLPASKRRSEKVFLSFTPAELRKIRKKAKKTPVDDWIRARALK
jgi:hypothetical protein